MDTRTAKLTTALLAWFRSNARDLPWRRTRDPYAIWVSEIMLQQTQVNTVIPYWERWMRELPTVHAAATASPARLHKLWEGLGYYSRVRNLQRAAQQLMAEHAGRFPQDLPAILELPGIGRYTAGAICSIAFNQPTPILDGNVIRVLTRIFGIATNPREKETNAHLWKLAEELVLHAASQQSESACSHLNQSLMELGALVCVPRSPNCAACPVQALCRARKQNRQAQIPNLDKRQAITARRFIAFVVARQGRYWVRQRPDGVVNSHLWEFPNTEVTAEPSKPPKSSASQLGLKIVAPGPIQTIKHSITRYRITLEVWRAQPAVAPRKSCKPADRWLTLEELQQLAFTSAHKKILARLGTAP